MGSTLGSPYFGKLPYCYSHSYDYSDYYPSNSSSCPLVTNAITILIAITVILIIPIVAPRYTERMVTHIATLQGIVVPMKATAGFLCYFGEGREVCTRMTSAKQSLGSSRKPVLYYVLIIWRLKFTGKPDHESGGDILRAWNTMLQLCQCLTVLMVFLSVFLAFLLSGSIFRLVPGQHYAMVICTLVLCGLRPNPWQM